MWCSLLSLAYASACNASINMVIPTSWTALTTPDFFDGPFGQGLNPATTAITFIAALAVGTGCIGVLIAM